MEVKEEIFYFIALKEISRDCDIKAAFNIVLCSAEVPIAKILCVSIHGTPSMTGYKN